MDDETTVALAAGVRQVACPGRPRERCQAAVVADGVDGLDHIPQVRVNVEDQDLRAAHNHHSIGVEQHVEHSCVKVDLIGDAVRLCDIEKFQSSWGKRWVPAGADEGQHVWIETESGQVAAFDTLRRKAGEEFQTHGSG